MASSPTHAWPPLPSTVTDRFDLAALPPLGDAGLIPAVRLSPLWQTVVLGDGSLTRTLQLLTGRPTCVSVIDVVDVGDADVVAPPETAQLRGPLCRRRVWLRSGDAAGSTNGGGVILAYAVSWWNADDYRSIMAEAAALPIGRTMATARLEAHRQLLSVWRSEPPGVDAGALAAGLGCADGSARDGVWSRHYMLHSGGRPLTLICEVFSPRLAALLGGLSGGAADGLRRLHDDDDPLSKLGAV